MRILAIWLLSAATCLAGWNTNIWPSWKVQREGYAHACQSYTGVVERYLAAGAPSTGPTEPWSRRSQQTMLSEYKGVLHRIIPIFVNSSVITDPTNAANAYLVANFSEFDSGLVNFPKWTITGLLSQCELPTNYLAYTPQRCLNGLGPFNDATDVAVVGHAMGWTNAYTAKGGSMTPDRTEWTTTDYGWNGIKSIVNRLKYIQASGGQLFYGTNELVGITNTVNDWNACVVGANDMYSNTPPSSAGYHFGYADCFANRGTLGGDTYYTLAVSRDRLGARRARLDARLLQRLNVFGYSMSETELTDYWLGTYTEVYRDYNGESFADGWNYAGSSAFTTNALVHVTITTNMTAPKIQEPSGDGNLFIGYWIGFDSPMTNSGMFNGQSGLWDFQFKMN